MTADKQQAILENFVRILRDSAFLFAEIPSDPDTLPRPSEESGFRRYEVTFSGETKGAFNLVFPRILCLNLTANMLGYEVDDPFVQDHSDDGACEILNILSSHFLTAIYGENAVFNLGVPSANAFSASEWDAFSQQPGSIHLLVDEHQVLLNARYEAK